MGMKFYGGLPETPCGGGSTLEATKAIRAWIPSILKELGIETLLDAPCGDCNWMAHIDLSDIGYIGCDIEQSHIDAAIKSTSNCKYRTYKNFDITLELPYTFPRADLMLCRDFMQHLPNDLVFSTIKNFIVSGIEWLMATSHTNDKNENINKVGGFRPLNLTKAPFGFPEPRYFTEDGKGRILGLWQRSDID